MCFNCNEVGNIATRYPDKSNNRNEDKFRGRKGDGKKGYKDKGNNSFYISDEQYSDESDDEVVYVAMKDESDEDEATTLMTCVNKNDRWIIDSGCSQHMTRDKSKFITLTSYDGNSVRFGNDAPCLIIEKRMMENTTKARSHATLLMNRILMKMMMKCCMLQ